MNKEFRDAIVFWLSFVSTTLSLIMFLGLAGAEAYTRYTLNQDFTFLGDFGLSALAFLVLGQIVALSFVHRSK